MGSILVILAQLSQPHLVLDEVWPHPPPVVRREPAPRWLREMEDVDLPPPPMGAKQKVVLDDQIWDVTR